MAYVSYDNITVTFKADEVFALIAALRASVKSVIDDKHYLSHPNSFEVNKGQDIRLFRTLSEAIGHGHLFEGTMSEVNQWLADVKAKKAGT